MPTKTKILQQLTDNEIICNVQAGDLNQIAELYQRYKQIVYAYLYGIHRDRDLAQDLLQMVFIRVMKYNRQFQVNSNFRNWLFHIAKNVSKDHFLKKSNRPKESLAVLAQLPAESQRADHEMMRQESHEQLYTALAQLSRSQREILVLSKLQGMRYADIGEILQCSEGAVKVKVYRALKSLREIYLKMENR